MPTEFQFNVVTRFTFLGRLLRLRVSLMISIRSETPADYAAIRHVIVDAFTECDYGYNGEAELVDQLRNGCDNLLALVATEGDTIIGHVLFSPVSVQAAGDQIHGMGLAPMAVHPTQQQTGFGTALVKAGLKQLSANGCPFVVVLGHPTYYPRLDFRPAKEHGLLHGFDGIPQDVFFVKVLDHTSIPTVANGTAIYRPEFGPQRDSP